MFDRAAKKVNRIHDIRRNHFLPVLKFPVDMMNISFSNKNAIIWK